MSKACRITEYGGQRKFIGRAGQIITPQAILRDQWVRAGFIEVFGEDVAERKEVAAEKSMMKRKRGRPRKNEQRSMIV